MEYESEPGDLSRRLQECKPILVEKIAGKSFAFGFQCWIQSRYKI